MPDHAQEVKEILTSIALDIPIERKKKLIAHILQVVYLEGKVEGLKERIIRCLNRGR